MTEKYGNERPEKSARELIDKLLEQAGWTLIREGKPIPEIGSYAVEEVQTNSGPMDYALVIDGTVVGDVEAKPVKRGIPGIIAQDERYSKTYVNGVFDFDGFHIPFLYASNGYVIWFKDVRSKYNLQRDISKFHKPSALKEYLDTKTEQSFHWLKENAVDAPGIRPYQKEAIESIESWILGHNTRMMVAMASGTGKTFTAAALIYRLLKSGTARRILFLVDRKALAAQAINEFASFEPEPAQKLNQLYEIMSQKLSKEDFEDENFEPNIIRKDYLTNPKSTDAFVYVCTVQKMRIDLFGTAGVFQSTTGDKDYEDEKVERLDIPIHAFDFIIADECHRGYTGGAPTKWREVLDHFDSIKIGLTATPAEHTTSYFKKVVYYYPESRAVDENYLVDWDLRRLNSDIRMNGLFLDEGDEVQYVDPLTGEKRFDQLEDERDFDIQELETKATAPKSNKLILSKYAVFAREFEIENGRFPKTLVFAVNDLEHTSHADTIVQILSEEFVDKGSGFVKKITGRVDRPLQKIREFRNRPEEPGIAVTVDMLSTGVDIPTIEAILFLRPVKSRILFHQMIGRGTRLAKDIGKTHFTVYDAVNVINYFKNVTSFREPLPATPTKSYKQIVDEIYNNKNNEYNIRILKTRLKRIANNIAAEGRQLFEPFIEDGDIEKFARNLKNNLSNEWKKTMDILRNERFQKLLVTYPKTRDDFVVAINKDDTISSEYYPIVISGNEYKPEDYLKCFKDLLRQRPYRIIALDILLNQPEDFNTDTLDELRKKLAECPEGFTELRLRKAYRNNLADIIGMIICEMQQQPLLTTKQRVQKAVEMVTSGRKFTEDEKQWLDIIAEHLEYNLLIEREHFSQIPFSLRGGWKKANEDFNNGLQEIIGTINKVMISV